MSLCVVSSSGVLAAADVNQQFLTLVQKVLHCPVAVKQEEHRYLRVQEPGMEVGGTNDAKTTDNTAGENTDRVYAANMFAKRIVTKFGFILHG